MHDLQLLPSRYYGLAAAVVLCAAAAVAATFDHRWLVVAGAAGILSLLGVYDVVQTRHAILRNYPVLRQRASASPPFARAPRADTGHPRA